MERKQVSSGSPYEKPIGFSRAVRIGNLIAVAGTAPVPPAGEPAISGAYQQTKRCLQIIEKAILDAGGTKDGVIRTRVFLTDASVWEEVGRAHGDFFGGEIRPACTFVVIKALLDPSWLVEIEADCIVA